jgi:hypothetical protein
VKRSVILTFLFLFLFSLDMLLIEGFSYNPLFVSDISFLFQKIHAQKWIFITPGASQSTNNDAFVPPMDIVSAGSIVTWTNEDSIIHTVTADNIRTSKSETKEGPLLTLVQFLQEENSIMHLIQ